MPDVSPLRRLRAILLNGLVWGGTWFVGITAMVMVLNVVDPPPPGAVGDPNEGWFLAASGGLLLFMGGAAFAAVVTFAFRGRRLADINWRRFAIGGGLVAGVVFPAFISLMRMFAGEPVLEVGKLVSSGLFGLVGGAILAAGTLRIAQWADRHGANPNVAEPDQIEGSRAAPVTRSDAERVADTR